MFRQPPLQVNQVEPYAEAERIIEGVVNEQGFLCCVLLVVKDVGDGYSGHTLTRAGPNGVPPEVQTTIIAMLRETADRLERMEPSEVASA